MNMFQTIQPSIQFNPKVAQKDVAMTKTSTTSNNEKFNQVFNQAVKPTQQKATEQPSTSKDSMMEVIDAKDAKQILETLGAEVDEAGLFVQVNGELIAMEELLTLENLANLLAMDEEDLVSLLKQFGLEESADQDIWAIIAQAPNLLQQLVEAMGEGEVADEDALALLQVLKVMEQVGQKVDTVLSQQVQIASIQAAFNELAPVLTSMLTQQVQPTTNTFNNTQLIQATPVPTVEVKVDTGQTNTQNESMFSQQQANQTGRTVAVTLPANPASQSEALAKEIANLVNRSQLMNSQGTIKLTLKLFPENLGQIRIEVLQQNGVMTARLLATTAAGKELLDSSLNQLKSAFVAQNLQVDRIDVAQALQETDKNFRDQGFFNNLFKQKQEDDSADEENEEDESVSFSELLEEVQE